MPVIIRDEFDGVADVSLESVPVGGPCDHRRALVPWANRGGG